MNGPRQRQLLLMLVVLVAIGATALVAVAKSPSSDASADRGPQAWVGSWSAAPTPPATDGAAFDELTATGFKNQTVRMIVHTSVGGNQGRVRLSNAYGTRPLVIGHVSVARPWLEAGPGDVRADSVREVTFNGMRTVTIPRGGVAVTDPIKLDFPWSGDVAISLFLPGPTGPPTVHTYAKSSSYIGPGDNASDPSGAKMAKTIRTWYFISGLDVRNDSDAGAVAVLGDSITDGVASTSNKNHRWTDFLAARLNKSAKDHTAPGVLNLGLAGNRLNHDGSDPDAKAPIYGENASARFSQDVLSQTDVRAVIVELGINDIWISKDDPNAIMRELQQLGSQAHQAGLKIFVCTISPWNAFAIPPVTYYTPELDTTRLTVNSYLRTTKDFDGIIDFDRLLRDPADPTKLRPDWDSGDHIHPNDAGNAAMATAVPVKPLLELADR